MAFAGRFMADTSAAAVGVMCALGNRLGLFRNLSENGPATSAELAARTGMNERYLREWLLALANAGYLKPAEDGRFGIPVMHAAILADEDGQFYMGDLSRLIPALASMLDRIADAFQDGTGVPADAYPSEFHATMWRKDASRLGRVLVPEWIPAVSGLRETLERGGQVAQLGCGDGRALVLIATAFPKTRCVGYDAVEVNIARARSEAVAAGVEDRISYRHCHPDQWLGDEGDGTALIVALDVLHDCPDPALLLRTAHARLAPDGVFLLLETKGPDRPLSTPGGVSALLYGISTLYSVPQGMANVSDPVGMMGLPPTVLLPMCRKAGFSVVREIQDPSPFNTLYELRP